MAQTKLGLTINDVGIAEALARWQLAVPPNQRRYAWEEDYVEQLFHDLTKAFDANKPIYFLGTIVLTEGKKETREIADGQQRLATVAILISAIRDYLLELDDKRGADQYQADYLIKYHPPSGTFRPKLKLNVEDDQYFFNNILLPPGNRPKESAAKFKSNERLRDASVKAHEHVRNIAAGRPPKDKSGRLYQWLEFLRDAALVVTITIPSHISDSFRMFETLNARGVPASQVDILKNFLFAKAPDQASKIQSRWMSMLSTVEAHGDDDLVLTFIRQFWISLHGPTTQKDLGEDFEREIRNEQQAVDFVTDLDSAADDYVALLIPIQHPRWNGFPTGTRKSIDILINDLKAVQIRSLMLAVTRHFSHKEASAAFRMFLSWTVRFLIVGGGGGGKLDRYYGTRAQAVTKGEIKSAKALAENMNGVVPANSQFQEEFGKSNVTSAGLARYYLRALELHGKDSLPQLLINEDPQAVTLEHVLPVNPSKEWKIDSETAATFYKRLGNMVLLGAKENSTLGNGPFASKRPILQGSPFTTTQDVGKQSKWGPDEIKARQLALATIAPKVWPL